MIRVRSLGDTLILKFNYAPDYVSRMRSIGGEPHKEENRWYWTLPQASFSDLETTFAGELVYETPRHMITGEPAPSLPDHVLAVSDDPLPDLLRLDLFPHQCRGIRFSAANLKEYGFTLLQDTVGLGKTAQALGTAELLRQEGNVDSPILIVCLASLKGQWLDEGVYKFTDRSGIVIDQPPKKRHALYEAWNDYDYWIINYELILRDKELLQKIPFEMAIVDEPHEKVLNPAGKMHKALASLDIRKRLFLTATPLNNSPIELFGMFKLCDPDILGRRTKFEKRYMRYDFSPGYPRFIGYRHLDELKTLITPYSIRRTRHDAGIPFPEVHRVVRKIESTRKQQKAFAVIGDYRQELSQRFHDLREKAKDEPDVYGKQLESLEQRIQSLVTYELLLSNWPSLLTNARSAFIKEKVAPIVANEKAPKFELFMDTMKEMQDEKVLVFTQFRTVAMQLLEAVNRTIGPAVPYVGQMSTKQRQESKDAFNKDSDVRAMVATSAGYTGLNLPAGSVCIHYDLPWAPTRVDQREGRLTRLDSTHKNILSYVFLTKGLSDEKVYEAVIEKKALFDFLV